MNAIVSKGSTLVPTFFLILINDFPDVISSEIGIYTDDTNTYYYLSSKSNRSDKLKLVAARKWPPISSKLGARNGFVKFQESPKTILLSFKNYKHFLPSISMIDAHLQESNNCAFFESCFFHLHEMK